MNENPGGAPSPLNPNPAPASTAPTPAPAPVEPVAPSAPQPSVAQPVTTEPVTAEPKKKSKGGLIAAIILLLVALVGGAVAAIVILKPFGGSGDAVPMAIQKLFGKDHPTKVSMNGAITMTSKDSSLPISSIKLDFNSGIDTTSNENYANVKVTATLLSGDDFSFDANEVHTKDGDFYLKLSNVSDAIDGLMNSETQDNCLEDGTNCIDEDYYDLDIEPYADIDIDCSNSDLDDESCWDVEHFTQPTPDMSDLVGFASVFEVIDGDWIRINGSDFSNITDVIPSGGGNTQCLIDAANGLGNYGDDFAKLYNDNPFINYSTNNLKIAQKKDQLYLLSFDANKLTNFLNAMTTSGFINDLIACTGGNATEEITTEEVASIIESFPALYVEINNNYDFTRVYLDMNPEDSPASLIVDLSFEYPTNITIEEPTEYVDINEVLSRVLSSFYGFSTPDQTDTFFTF